MNKNLWMYSIMLLAISSLLLGSCSANDQAPIEQIVEEEIAAQVTGRIVGISLPTEASSRWIRDGEIMENTLSGMGYGVILAYANNKWKTQQAQIQDMLANGVNILVIAPVDGATLSDLLKAAHESGVLVIAFDRMITNTTDVDFFITFNHFAAGVLQGNQIEKALGLAEGKGPFNFELFAGSPYDPNALSYYEGSLSILQPYIDNGQLVLQSRETGMEEVSTLNWDDVTAQARMKELLDSYYQRIRVDVILSPSDRISRGILAALKKANYGTEAKPWPIVTGQDAEVESIKALAAGEQAFTILKDTREMAKQTAQMVNAVLQGLTVPINNTKNYNNGVKIVATYELFPVGIDIHNYEELIVNSGYLTEEQLKWLSEK